MSAPFQVETHQSHPRRVVIRKRDLAIKLQMVGAHPKPKVALEQYTIPADLAADILFLACYSYGDIEGKFVADLGTGTGRLALGASMLGAEFIVGIDVDRVSLDVAAESSNLLKIPVDWVLGDIETLKGPVDTVLMNPPFGTKQPHADLKFLEVAIRSAKTVYSIHKSSTRSFLTGWLRERHATPEAIVTTKMEIPHQFFFHRKRRRYVDVDVFRIK